MCKCVVNVLVCPFSGYHYLGLCALCVMVCNGSLLLCAGLTDWTLFHLFCNGVLIVFLLMGGLVCLLA